MKRSEINKKVEEIAKQYASIIRDAKVKSKLDVAWDDIRYCILEIHYAIESDMDKIIAKRYVGRNAHVCSDVMVTILSKVDFARKVTILEEIQSELQINLPVSKIKAFNNLRNALIHNYPKSHSFFKYSGGHIYNDLKIEDVCKDALVVFEELGKAKEKIPVKPYRI